MIVRMWEVKSHPEALADLLAWVCDAGLPQIEQDPMHVSSDVYTSTDNRIVVISKWRHTPLTIEDPPRYLVARPPHSWDFTEVDR